MLGHGTDHRERGTTPAARAEAGEGLLEVLVAMVLLATVGAAVLMGLAVASRSSATLRAIASSEVAIRNISDALGDAAYIPCAQPDDYRPAATAAAPAGFTVDVLAVQRWNGARDVPTFEPFPAGCLGAATLDEAADTSLQQIRFRVRRSQSTGAGVAYERVLAAVKWFDGTLGTTDLIPSNAFRCTISGSSVADAVIDQAQPGANRSTATSLDVSKAAGKEQSVLLRFDLTAGATPCRGANDTAATLPLDRSGMVVARAELTLYNWRIDGAVTCPSQCTQAFERVTSAWAEGGVTWASAPSTISPGRITSTREVAVGTFGPGFQTVSSAALTADVQSFYGAQTAADRNNGWKISEACGTGYPGRTCAASPPGFQFRSHEWRQASQRPSLEVILTPRTGGAVQLRNVATDQCASVRNDDGDATAADLVALSCNGKGYQGWTQSAALGQFKTMASTGRVIDRRCIDGQEAREATRRAVTTYQCFPDRTWQQVRVDGSALKIRQKVNGTTVDQCLAVETGTLPVGRRLILDDCNGSTAQQWAVEPQQGAPPPPLGSVRLRNVKGNSCTDIESGRADRPPYWTDASSGVAKSTSRTEQFPCFGGTRPSQHWLFDGYERIVNERDQTSCLDGGNGNGDLVTVNYCSNGNRQQWAIEQRDGYALIRNLITGGCLEGGSDGYQQRVQPCVEANLRQRWAIEPVTAPSTVVRGWLRNEGNFNTCLEPDGDQAPSHTRKLWTWPCSADRPYQEFIRLRVSDTQVQYRPVSALGLCVDGAGGGNGTDTILYNCNVQAPSDASASSNSQQWTLSPSPDLANPPLPSDTQSRQIRSAESQRCLQAVTLTGTGDYAKARDCVASTNATAPYQRWYFEPVGTLRQETRQLRSVLRADSGCALPFDGISNLTGKDLTTWPCSGSGLPTQSILRLTNGQIRLASQITRCLDSTSNTAGSNVYFNGTCGQQYQQRWKYTELPNGRVWIRLQDHDMCLKAGLDMATVKLAACSLANATQAADPSLQWRLEAFGTAADPREGHLRGTETGDCLEPDSATIGDETRVWNWPCAGTTRAGQRFVLLNTGELRSRVDLRYCLDDGSGGSKANLADRNHRMHLYTCRAAPEPQQQWGADVGGVRYATIQTGIVTPTGAGLLRNGRMAGFYPASCVRMIPGKEVDRGLGATGGQERPNDQSFRKGNYAFTRIDCTNQPGRQTWAFEPVSTASQVNKQLRSGGLTGAGCVEPKNPADNRSDLWIWPCAGAGRAAQAFVLTSDEQIRNPANGGFCLDGRNVRVDEVPYYSECHGDSNQRWTRVPVPGNPEFVQLRNGAANGTICLYGDLDATMLKLATCHASVTSQWFAVEDVGATVTTRYVRLHNVGSGRCLAPDGVINDGRSLWASGCTGSTTVFLFTNNKQLHPLGDLSACLGYDKGTNPSGTVLRLRPCQDQVTRATDRSQLWSLDGTGRLVNDREPVKCVREVAAAQSAAPFNVGDYAFVTDCLPAGDGREPRQRWTLDEVALP